MAPRLFLFLSAIVRAAVFAAVSGLALPAMADDAATVKERVRIQAEIKRLNAAYAAEEAACRDRFAVTACADDVRLRRRDALAPLRTRGLALDDAERRERAALRLREIEHKRLQSAQGQGSPAVELREPAARPPRAALAPALAASNRADSAPQRQAAASQAAAGRATAAQRRRQQIQEGAARVQARQAERERMGRVAAPLPVPAANLVNPVKPVKPASAAAR